MSNEVKFKATIIRNRFNSEDFKIYVADVNKQIYKDLKGNRNNEYILVGNTPNLIPDVEYDITAIPEINKKFGIQYKVLTIKRDKPTDYNSSKSFLDEILTKAQSEVLLSVYPNIIDKIVKNDLGDIDLQKTKGIKEPTFDKIKNKVI
jgi:exodeoxyribonuclease V alpha subunit